jgi:hypothetical protein
MMIRIWLKNSCQWLLFAGLLWTILIAPLQATNAADLVTLTVLNPRADIKGPQPIPPASRLRTLEGKKIGVINNSKLGADLLQPELEKALKTAVPMVQLKSYSISYLGFEGKDEALREAAHNSDGIILFLGD